MQAPCPEIYILDAKCLSREVLPPIQKKEQSRRRQPTVPSNMHSLPPEVQSHGQTTGQFLNSGRESVVGAAIVLDRHAYYNNYVCIDTVVVDTTWKACSLFPTSDQKKSGLHVLLQFSMSLTMLSC